MEAAAFPGGAAVAGLTPGVFCPGGFRGRVRLSFFSVVSVLNRGLFSSASSEWETPQKFFETLDVEFGFTLDVCARPENAKCPRYFSPEEDGLRQEWAPEVCWMNPPYGREIGKWIQKAYEEAQKGATVVCLLPSRTDTAWWHEYVMRAAEVRFIRGRLRFGGAENGAPFPSCVVVFRPGYSGPPVVKSMAAR